MTDSVKLPSDVNLNLWLIMQEDLVKKHEQIEELLKLHERELILVWGVSCGTLILMLATVYYVKRLKETYERQNPRS